MNKLSKKIELAEKVIDAAMGQFARPCVLWSGGKDSMVLLHRLRAMGHEKLDVICWREPWLPEKQEFANRIIQEWDLTVWDYAPTTVGLCKGNGRIDVMNCYSIGQELLVLARGTEAPEPGNDRWLCGRETFLNRPVGTFIFRWDAMFHGHKSCDVDPCSGGVPLEVDMKYTPGSSTAVFPLRHWSDEDVFAYIEEYDVPYDTNRYKRAPGGGWITMKDKRLNPDYYHTCLKCCDPDEEEFVMCPKTGLQINNVAGNVLWIKPQMGYCNLRVQKEVAA